MEIVYELERKLKWCLHKLTSHISVNVIQEEHHSYMKKSELFLEDSLKLREFVDAYKDFTNKYLPTSYAPGSAISAQINNNIPHHIKISSPEGVRVSKAAGAATDAYLRHGLNLEVMNQGLVTKLSPLDNWESSFGRNSSVTPAVVISQSISAASRAEARSKEELAKEKTALGKIARYLSAPKDLVSAVNYQNRFLRWTIWAIGYFLFYIAPAVFATLIFNVIWPMFT